MPGIRASLVLTIALISSACEGSGLRDAEAEASFADGSADAAIADDAVLPDSAPEASSSDGQGSVRSDVTADTTDACVDQDGDGYLPTACGGGDCDDSNRAYHPEASVVCGKNYACEPNIDRDLRSEEAYVQYCLRTRPVGVTSAVCAHGDQLPNPLSKYLITCFGYKSGVAKPVCWTTADSSTPCP